VSAVKAQTAQLLNEAQWQRQVIDLATQLGWAEYHAYLSIRSPRGWPDLSLCRPPRLVLAELKTDRKASVLAPSQQDWIALLERCPGVEVYVWRPSDLDDVVRILR
jgi:hypothetical protein